MMLGQTSQSGGKEIRTPDPLHAMQVLYQLSYTPEGITMLAGKAFGVKMHRVQGTVKQVEGPGSPGALLPPSKELVQQYGADPQLSHGDGFNRCGTSPVQHRHCRYGRAPRLDD